MQPGAEAAGREWRRRRRRRRARRRRNQKVSSVLAVAEMRKGKDDSSLDDCVQDVESRVRAWDGWGRCSVRTNSPASLCTKYYCRIPNCSAQPIFDVPHSEFRIATANVTSREDWQSVMDHVHVLPLSSGCASLTGGCERVRVVCALFALSLVSLWSLIPRHYPCLLVDHRLCREGFRCRPPCVLMHYHHAV